MQQWSLGVQRELFANTTLELNYIGTKGTNLLMRQNVAQALRMYPQYQGVQARSVPLGRSIYHDRPRGIVSAGPEEPNALVQFIGHAFFFGSVLGYYLWRAHERMLARTS